MPQDYKKLVDKNNRSIGDKFYIPLLILRIIVISWYTYVRFQLVGLVIVLIIGIFSGTLFTLAGLYYGGAIIALYLGLYFLYLWFEKHNM